MSTHNIGFYEDLTKIIFESSSNTHLTSSAVCVMLQSIHSSSSLNVFCLFIVQMLETIFSI